MGHVSNDGLGHSFAFAEGRWRLNPNHLFFEPLGAWWQALWARLDPAREPVDALKLLSGLSGALAAGLFRWGVARRLAESRWAANHATAWLALSSAFLRLWISDEIHMIQMPFVVLAATMALRSLEKPALSRALALGAAVGIAGLGFISNLLLGPSIALCLAGWHLRRREGRRAVQAVAGIGIGSAAVAGSALLAVWASSPAPVTFLDWMTRYGGGLSGDRVSSAYGVELTPSGVALSTARALYGSASALVDVMPAVGAIRDGQVPGPWELAGVAALLSAGSVLLYGLWRTGGGASPPGQEGGFLLTLAWLLAILGFGIYWNNSDDQFYFQLAVVFGALAARIPRGPVLALSCVGLLWNVVDVTHRHVLYPRQERLALVEQEVRGACLVVYPGFDEASMLLALSDTGTERLALTDLATMLPPEAGASALVERVWGCVETGGRVVLVDLYDTPPLRNPWKFLHRLGYERSDLHAALAGFPVDRASRRVGPFTVREIGPR